MLTRLVFSLVASLCCTQLTAQQQLNTEPLTEDVDFASEMVAGIDSFLLNKLTAAPADRHAAWFAEGLSEQQAEAFFESKRMQLAKMIGAAQERYSFEVPEVVGTTDSSATFFEGDHFTVTRIRWPVLSDPAPTARNLASIHGEGLLLEPTGDIAGTLIAIPDAGQSPEQLAGLTEGIPAASQFARRAAECGFRVIVPTTIGRDRMKRNGRANLTDREYLYRSAFELGRHIIGYEVQKVRAICDWLEKVHPSESIAVAGYGEGGLISLYAAAIDSRIDGVCVSGCWGPLEDTWQQPLDRNVFGVAAHFGIGELARMTAAPIVAVELTDPPDVVLTGDGGAPAEIKPASDEQQSLEIEAAQRQLLVSDPPSFCTDGVRQLLSKLTTKDGQSPVDAMWPKSEGGTSASEKLPDSERLKQQIAARHLRQFEEIDRHNQAVLRESPFVRKEFFKRLKTSSVEAYEESVEEYRTIFRDEVVGRFDDELLPFNARSRQTWESEKWTGHEVVLDVYEDVFAYGVLLLPKDLKKGEKRPVVVCQHGLEGRPTDTFLDDHRAYHDYAAKLCERGFIVFAPQNPYIFKDRFRTLQRKANLLGKTLFSIIVPQHQQIVNWLKSQSFVDSDRIAFYGLSYGGKSAMRIPALVTDYCLSICSADFNEWVRKNASTRLSFSYMWAGEYEIFEWDLGSTFNYFEMAALICPRPFMVERGHFDGVGSDEWVGYEYAKVRHLYAAKLKIPERTEIEWFDGPHMINGKGTFDFLHRHLNWPKK